MRFFAVLGHSEHILIKISNFFFTITKHPPRRKQIEEIEGNIAYHEKLSKIRICRCKKVKQTCPKIGLPAGGGGSAARRGQEERSGSVTCRPVNVSALSKRPVQRACRSFSPPNLRCHLIAARQRAERRREQEPEWAASASGAGAAASSDYCIRASVCSRTLKHHSHVRRAHGESRFLVPDPGELGSILKGKKSAH